MTDSSGKCVADAQGTPDVGTDAAARSEISPVVERLLASAALLWNGDADDRIAAKALHDAIEEITRLEHALVFYADPDSYAAAAFMFDPPCGDFNTDFSYRPEYERPMPGKRARIALGVELTAEQISLDAAAAVTTDKPLESDEALSK